MRSARWLICGTLALLLFTDRAFADVQAQPRKRAVLIGVKTYQHISSLNFSERDVEELAKVLKSHDYDIALVCHSAGKGDAELAPTRVNILKHLEKAFADCKEGDILLVAFAGHGLQFAMDNASYFCPMDANPTDRDTLISLKVLYEKLENCKGFKLMLVDACRNEAAPPPVALKRGFDLLIPNPPPPMGVAVLFSCSRGKVAWERPDLQHGVFFHHVIEGLKGAAGDEGSVDMLGLANYATTKMRAERNPQVPVLVTNEVSNTTLAKVKATVKAAPLLPAVNPNRVVAGMEFVLVQPGEFERGADDADAEDEEKPRHTVRLTQGFWIAQREVTQRQYRERMQINPTPLPDDDLPARDVTWLEAIKFCNRLSEWKEVKKYYAVEGNKVSVVGGPGFRLPTEAEWEYACRAGTKTPWSFGANGIGAENFGWFSSNSKNKPAAGGSKSANPLGLHDMHGNVWEWCWDGYIKYTPTACTDPMGDDRAGLRVARGGSYRDSVTAARTTSRLLLAPTLQKPEVGFRVVRSPE